MTKFFTFVRTKVIDTFYMYRPTWYNVIRHYFRSDNISREKSTIIAFYHIALNIKDYYWMTNDQTLVSRRSISPLVIPNNL